MQTLFVVKVSYFGLRQFTRNPTTREGVRKEAEEEDRNNDDAIGGDTEVEDRHNLDPSSGEGSDGDPSPGEDRDHDPNPDEDHDRDACHGEDHDRDACHGQEGEVDPAQAKLKNHHRDSGQRALKVPDRDHFPAYLQPHKLERMLIQS